MKKPHCHWVGWVFCASVALFSAAVSGAGEPESAALDVPPARALGLDAAREASWSTSLREMRSRGGPSLRIPKALLAQTSESVAALIFAKPAPTSFLEFGARKRDSGYDFFSPQTYRISAPALSLGTTAQRWLTPTIALQGSAFAGVGYAAVGTFHGAFEGDYQYGLAPQGRLALRVIFGDNAALDVTGREYFVPGVTLGGAGGYDNIASADASFTVRIYKQHSISAKYLWNRRDASYPLLGDRTQVTSTLGIFYSYTGDDRMGAVDWR